MATPPARQWNFSLSNLLKRFSSDDSKNILYFSKHNDVEGIRAIARRDRNIINFHDPNSFQTALHVAAFEGHIGLVDFLLELGADVNKRDMNGWTALHCCCKGNTPNFVEIARILILNGKSQVNSLTNSGGTPLHYYVESESLDVQLFEDTIDLMVREGADVNSQSKNGETPLHFAITKGRMESVQILLKNGALPNLRNKDGETALHYAIKNNHQNIAKLLIDSGADPTIESTFGCCRQYCNRFSQVSILAHLNSKLKVNDTNDENNIIELTKKKLEIDTDIVEKVVKMGYDSMAIMSTLRELHKNGKSTTDMTLLLCELGETTNVASSASTECKICLEEIVNCVILPCKHSCMCVSCGDKCKNTSGECPICREKITDIIQIYFS